MSGLAKMNLSKLIDCPDTQSFSLFTPLEMGVGRGEWSVCTDWSCIMRRGRKVKRKALNRQKKKKVANRILLGLHFVFVCRKKKKEKREKEGKMQLL